MARSLLGLLSVLCLLIPEPVPALQSGHTETGGGHGGAAAPGGLSAGDWASLRERYDGERHAVHAIEDGHRARNPGQQWGTSFDGRGFTVTPDSGAWTWGLELVSYGFPGAVQALEGRALVAADGSRVAYAWGPTLEEWYVNDRRGLEHGYTLRERPRRAVGAEGPLTFTLAVRGGLQPEVTEDGRGAGFVDERGATVLTYSGLQVFDSEGSKLPARIERASVGLQLIVDEREAHYPLTIDPIAQQAYLKASNTGCDDRFGVSVAISGNTVVIGADGEASNATGVNGNQLDDSASFAGAAYVFVRSGASWSQQAYLKASNAEAGDTFGSSVAISADTIVVGAPKEDSNATGVDGDQGDNSSVRAGAAYVFVRSGTTWSQQAYLKASNTEGAVGARSASGGSGDEFGTSVSVSGDTIVIGANSEASNATGVNGNQSDDSAFGSGAAYVFTRSGTTWTQQAYLKASNTDENDLFGSSVSVSGDTLVVGADGEASNATGVNGDESNNLAPGSGAAYVYVRSGTSWNQQAYLKASNTGPSDRFGRPVSVSADTLVIGAVGEDSNATGVSGNQADDSASFAGAAYVFVRSGTTWTQQAYLKASNTDGFDQFGRSVCVSGGAVIVGAPGEASNATGVDGDQGNNLAPGSGAAYLYVRSGTTWSQQAYLKASNTGALDYLGLSVSVGGDTIVIGAYEEGSNSTGVNGDQNDNSLSAAGAAYVVALTTTWTGATDSDWTDTTNWTDAVPDSTRTAIIPDAATTPNDPVISVAGQTCNTLWIQTAGTLDISAGMDSLSVLAGAIVEGPITGTGELVFTGPATLEGSATISLTHVPAVRADADLTLQGGPLTITGSVTGNADIGLAAGATIDIGDDLTVLGDLDVFGDLTVGDSMDIGGTLASSASGSITTGGVGECITAGQVCIHSPVNTACSLAINNPFAGTTNLEIDNPWPSDISVDVAGTVTLLTPAFTLTGDLILESGTFAVGVNGTIDAAGIEIQSGATLDFTGFQTLVPAPAPIAVLGGGKLNIGPDGELLLESNTLTVESGGTLCLDGLTTNRASLSGAPSERYTLDLQAGSTLAAKGFAFQGMESAGIVIGSGVTLAPEPFDLRAGLFDDVAPGGVLLDIERSVPTEFRYLRFENTGAAGGAFNVRTSLASAALKLVNWSGGFAGEPFEDDPGAGEPGLIEWAPPETSDVQGFAARWGSDHVKVSWTTLAEVDTQSFQVQRSPEPPTLFATIAEELAAGPGAYHMRDNAVQVQTAYRYRLFEFLTHGELRFVDEVTLGSAGSPDVLLPVRGAPAPPAPDLDLPPLLSFMVGDGGRYPTVRAALRDLASRGQRDPVTLELAAGRHEAFELGPELGFDLCLTAQAHAVIDASGAPLRIHGLASGNSLELVGLVVDARTAAHPAVVIEDTTAVVLFQQPRLLGDALAPAMRLNSAQRVVLQGGRIDGLGLQRGSRATASGVELAWIELSGSSTLETRGKAQIPARVEPGSLWLAHGPAPRLTVRDGVATLEGASGLAWLGLATTLDFRPSVAPPLEGVQLLHRPTLLLRDPTRSFEGHVSWELGALPPDVPLYLQALSLDPLTRRLCTSDVLRLGPRR